MEPHRTNISVPRKKPRWGARRNLERAAGPESTGAVDDGWDSRDLRERSLEVHSLTWVLEHGDGLGYRARSLKRLHLELWRIRNNGRLNHEL